ncbi:hypothetical protein [Streptomyces sp. NRRL S-118]|uniref:hypothetical protein n=1 Tax=Streptomyces sp. NRRL S-118 TaxID=1463881 RepID=UPI001F256A08|nr:hypothetical protein [Streptomyces sp. NRRL S-118]
MLTGLAIGNLELPIPVLTGQSGQFLLAHLMTLIPAATLLYGLGRGDSRATNTALRNIRHWDAALGLLTAAAGAAIAVVCYLALDSDLAVILGRNVASYVGLALLLHPFLGYQLAAAAIAAVPLVLAAGGWRPNGTPETWAWLLHDAGSALALLFMLVFLCLGAVASIARPQLPLRLRTHF